jgi:integrase
LLVFLSQTGARFIEAKRLTKVDLRRDGAEPFCLLRTKKRRGGHERVRPQPLTRLALDAIESTANLSPSYVFPDGHGAQLSYRAELKRLHSLCVRLELPLYSFHQVRHWAGGVATAMGKNKKAVATFLGHADTHPTERYLHYVERDMWEVARELEAELSAVIGPPENSVTTGAATNE